MPRAAQLVSLAAAWGLITLILVWAFAFGADRQSSDWPAFAWFMTPLLLPLPGMWRGQPKAFLLGAFVSMLYVFHGLVTLISSPGERNLGTLEALLGLVLLTVASLRARWGDRAR
jgi:uncharacterized membrane protein